MAGNADAGGTPRRGEGLDPTARRGPAQAPARRAPRPAVAAQRSSWRGAVRRKGRLAPRPGRLRALLCGAAGALLPVGRPCTAQQTLPLLVSTRTNGGANETLATLTELLDAASRTATLSQAGPWTLFAPSDQAFEQLPGGIMDMLRYAKADTDLRSIINAHILSGARNISWFNGSAVPTYEAGASIWVKPNATAAGLAAASLEMDWTPNATVMLPDQQATNGVLHLTDAVLVPPTVTLPSLAIPEAVVAWNYTSFTQALDASGLAPTLRNLAQTAHLTCFVPTNAAFAGLDRGALSLLLADQGSLARLLMYHCIPAFHTIDSLKIIAQRANGSNTAPTLEGSPLVVTVASNGTLYLNNTFAVSARHAAELQAQRGPATILQGNLFTTSGVLHTIDRVLVPPGFVWPGSARAATPSPATWTDPWPTPWLHCPHIPFDKCPELLPLRPDPVTVLANTQVDIVVQVWCHGRPVGGLARGSCSAHANFEVLDSGSVVSTLESQLRVSVAPGTVLSLILIDLSNSVNQNSQAMGWRKQAAIRYIDKVLSPESLELTGAHMVAVYAFDGRAGTQLVTAGVGPEGWSADRDALVTAVNALECGQSALGIEYCRDPSTNLHGALQWGAQHLQRMAWATNLNGRNTSCGLDAFLVFFSDGLDQANYGDTALDVFNELRLRGVKALGVAHESDTTYVSALHTIVGDPRAVFVAPERSGVPDKFEEAAEVAVAYASRAYQLSYCSPRRAGVHALHVRARVQGVTGETMEFVLGEQVLYRGQEMGTIIGVDRYNLLGDTYTVFLSSGNRAVIARGSELELVYSTAGFANAQHSCMLARTDPTGQAPAEATPPYADPADQLQQLRVAPYSCTAGGEYSCTTERCECAAGRAPGSLAQCPLTAAPTIVTTSAVRQCTSAFPTPPVAFTSFNWSANSRLTLDFTAVCNDGLPFGGMSFSPCPTLSSLALLESDEMGVFKKVSLYESRPRITCLSDPVHVVSLLLFDTSASIVRGAGGLDALKAAAIAYIDGLAKKLPSHTIGVHTFDGRAGTQQLIDFNPDAAVVKSAIAGLQCDGVAHCADPASNLFGSIVHVNEAVLNDFDTSVLARAPDGSRRQPYLVIFSDGEDTARRATLEQAVAAATFGRGVIGVGLQGEVPTTSQSISARGVHADALARLSTNGVFFASSGGLVSAFEGVADAIATSSATRFRLDYCSPKRRGLRTLRLEFRPTGGRFQNQRVTYWEQTFDAGLFQCRDGGCARCLGGLNNDLLRRSCASQPGPYQQSFVCEAEALPVAVNGYCRCPCTDAASYPPASQEGPGPIKCEVPGVCSAKRPPLSEQVCDNRGGLPANRASTLVWARTGAYWTASDGTRFGTAPNSHVSIEFQPTCADGWNIPGLRMSACSGLSDFRVLETDAAVAAAPILVDPWESEPRVLCHPDILTLILLDTSGSIKQGDSGEQSLRDGVARYLAKVNETVQELDVTHLVAIFAFDGQDSLQTITDFTDPGKAFTTMQVWGCDGVRYCVDPSTDLNGAVVRAVDILRNEQQGLVWTTKPMLIIFTDGTDQAARQTSDFAVAQIRAADLAVGLSVYGVGLIGETDDAKQGLDEAALKTLAFSGIFIAAAAAELAAQFEKVAGAVQDAVTGSASANYRIDYCSPKRQGLRRTIIRLSLDGSSYEWFGPTFNASEFSCLTGACTGCLRNKQYTCEYQPQQAPGDRDPQFFSCASGTPLILTGDDGERKCKCPCTGTYPPDPTPAPDPSGTPSPGTVFAAAPVVLCRPPGAAAALECTGAMTVPFAVSMSSSTPSALIYYSTDGSAPTTASTRYVTQFFWPTPGVVTIRAVAVRAGLQQSGITTRTVLATAGTPVPGSSPPLVTSLPAATGNQPPRATVAVPVVTVPVGGQPFARSGVLTAVSGPEVGQTVRASCSSQAVNFFSAGPSLAVAGGRGDLSLTLLPQASGDVAVTCVLTDDGAPPQSTAVSFVVQAAGTAAPSGGPCGSWDTRRARAMRLKLLLSPAAFRTAPFAAAVRAATTQPLVAPFACVYSLCPAAACEPAGCPATTAAKQAAGCSVGSAVPSRQAAALQNGVYVDFDVVTATPDTSPLKDAERERAYADLAADARICASGGSCQLRAQQPAGPVVWVAPLFSTPAPTPSGDDDDSFWTTPVLIGIIGGGVVYLIIVAVIAWLALRQKPAARGAAYAERSAPDVSGSQDDQRSSGQLAEKPLPTAHKHPPPGATQPSFAPHSQLPPPQTSLSMGQRVRALYIDGAYYEATVYSRDLDGTYGVQWYDGTLSEGIPPEQMQVVV
eukprot:TRINITY_DN5376_c0_g1_i1.p1 TRINITY_DN5376_c0_g1~~TRINITY_DN5376_c0_g1_i1.p1  ORF type:complete len:2309 (+),score=628.32 TRINITY_DN5376_c0_g1_i1:52-6927(+)